MDFSNAKIRSGCSIFHSFIKEPHKDLDWKGSLEVILSNLLLQPGLSSLDQIFQGLIQSNIEILGGWDFSRPLFQCCTALISFLISSISSCLQAGTSTDLLFSEICMQGLHISLPEDNITCVVAFACTAVVLSPVSSTGLGDWGRPPLHVKV